MKPLAVMVAGGTGGHINAAIAMGERASAQGYDVRYLTGQRPLDYKLFKGLPVTHLGSWPLRTKNPLKLLLALARNFAVFVGIFFNFLRTRPRFIVGAGGYVCGPTLLAGRLLGIPVFIFEQNAVMGLTNRLLARMSTRIFTHFKQTHGLVPSLEAKVMVVGNPTRQSITFKAPRPSDGELRVLIFGGSLGATQINTLIKEWVSIDSPTPVSVIHQTGHDENPVPKLGHNVTYKPTKYLDHIQEQYAWCDVIVARAGASSVAELRIVRRPCFLIPFPQATDNHQWWNAKQFQGEADFTVDIVDPRAPKDELASRLAAFLSSAQQGALKTSQSPGAALDSGQVALQEILKHVGTERTN